MAALSELQLLPRATGNLLPAIQEGERIYAEILEHSAPTSAVNGLRAMQLQRVVLVVGMFSVFEAAAKNEFGWEGAVPDKVKAALNVAGESALGDRFQHFWDANNVLKHGRGSSYEKLLKLREVLPFKVKAEDENFFEEGDISEVHSLVLVDDEFVLGCAEAIERTALLLVSGRANG